VDPSSVGWIVAGVIVLVGAWVVQRWNTALAEARGRADRAERSLEERRRGDEAEQRIRRLILSALEDGILLFGADSSLAYANDAARDSLGSVPTFLDALLPLSVRAAVLAARRTRTVDRVVVELGAPSRWLEATIVPDVEAHTLVVLHDVTDERRLDAVRRDFIENASHELKTPAATIQATAETLRVAAADDPSAIPRFSAQLEREAVRLSRLVADLLDLSRVESGSSSEDQVSVAAIVREECDRLHEDAQHASVAVELRAAATSPIRGSARDIRLLARNLIDNAIRYSREGDSVVVDVEDRPGAVILRVRDTGIGIPTRDLERIFERFYRVDRARSRETGGTGLGLAIVRHVAENHGGSVSVGSELGRGTTFEVTLPASAQRDIPERAVTDH
jgi:two-component system sensor histidine kinase SenX3